MLAAAGIVIPEGLQANGANIKGGTWFETGSEMLNGGTLNYFAVPWGVIDNPLPLFLVTVINVRHSLCYVRLHSILKFSIMFCQLCLARSDDGVLIGCAGCFVGSC